MEHKYRFVLHSFIQANRSYLRTAKSNSRLITNDPNRPYDPTNYPTAGHN